MAARLPPSPTPRKGRPCAALHALADSVRQRFVDARMGFDAAVGSESGTSYLDVVLGPQRVAVEWSKRRGFGVSSRSDIGYGEGPDEVLRTVEEAGRRVTELLLSRTGTTPPPPQGLSALRRRLGYSQVELAKRMKIQQASISKLERRPDALLSTLRAYLEAMGGELEIQARFRRETFRLDYVTAAAKGGAKARRRGSA